MSNFSQGQGN